MTVENNGHCSRIYRCSAAAVRSQSTDLQPIGIEVFHHVGLAPAAQFDWLLSASLAVDRDLPRLAGSFTVTSSERSHHGHDVAKLCSRSADPWQVHAERFSLWSFCPCIHGGGGGGGGGITSGAFRNHFLTLSSETCWCNGIFVSLTENCESRTAESLEPKVLTEEVRSDILGFYLFIILFFFFLFVFLLFHGWCLKLWW